IVCFSLKLSRKNRKKVNSVRVSAHSGGKYQETIKNFTIFAPHLLQEPMQNILAFKEFLKQPRKVVIVTHYKPDADALGSSLGLAGYLKKTGHSATVITPSDYPEFLTWMPGNSDVVIFNRDKIDDFAKRIDDSDLIFCLDFSSLKRINELGELVGKSSAKKVLIDHHLEPERFADFVYWDSTAASTAELVYALIHQLDEQHHVDADIAN